MKTYEAPEYIFNNAFNQVVFVFYNRYPNSFAKHVISEDIISQEVNGYEIYTKKLIVKKGFVLI